MVYCNHDTCSMGYRSRAVLCKLAERLYIQPGYTTEECEADIEAQPHTTGFGAHSEGLVRTKMSYRRFRHAQASKGQVAKCA